MARGMMRAPMRRLARHLFTIFSAISLLLFVAACMLWVRSYWRLDQITHVGRSAASDSHTELQLESDGGVVNLQRWRLDLTWASGPSPSPQAREAVAGIVSGAAEPQGWRWAHVRSRMPVRWGNLLAFGGDLINQRHTYGPASEVIESNVVWRVQFPWWCAAGVFAVPPGVWLPRLRRQQLHNRRGLCPTCGYDLRAHSAGDRCPECGTITSSRAV